MITINTKVTRTYTINGITDVSYELKEAIQKFLLMNTSPKDEISTEIDDDGKNIIVTSTVDFHCMKLFELQQSIPKMIEAIQKKHRKDEILTKKAVLAWKKKKLPKGYFKSDRMTKFVEVVNDIHDSFTMCKKIKDWNVALCYAGDFDDLVNILTLIDKSEYKEAYHAYRSLDTIVRDDVPEEVVQMLIDKAGM